MQKLNWSQWLVLLESERASVYHEPGVYQIRWAMDGKPQSISRANGIDDTGCLYIGKTIDLKRRVNSLLRGIIQGMRTNTVSYAHTAVYTYTFYGFAKKFKPEQLEIRWAQLQKGAIDLWEESLLGKYVEKYLDKPPLNISLRRM